MKILLELWLPIIAILISVVALIISYLSYRVSHKSFKVSLNPILKVKFITDRKKKNYSLLFLNDGPNNICEVKIRYICGLISENFQPLTSLYSKNDWNFIEVLQRNKSNTFIIPNTEIERAFQGVELYVAKENKPIGVVFTLIILFRREIDRKEYRESKTIFFFRDSQTNEIGDLDPNELGSNYWINAANKLGEIYKDVNF
ncbi:MAG: hypothetical protein AB1432_16240 [Bacteroidota bacterium]|jgi:hypothetical protein